MLEPRSDLTFRNLVLGRSYSTKNVLTIGRLFRFILNQPRILLNSIEIVTFTVSFPELSSDLALTRN